MKQAMKYHLVVLVLLTSLSVAAQSPVQKSKLDTLFSYFPVESRPGNSEDTPGYIHPWSLDKDGADVTVQTRVRYFNKSEGELFDRI